MVTISQDTPSRTSGFNLGAENAVPKGWELSVQSVGEKEGMGSTAKGGGGGERQIESGF